MGIFLSVGVGGGLGALARYYIAGWVQPPGFHCAEQSAMIPKGESSSTASP